MEKLSQIAESLFVIVHSRISMNVDFVEKVCRECYKDQGSFSKEDRNEISLEYINLIIRIVNDILDDDKTSKLLEELEKVFWTYISVSAEQTNIESKEFKIYFYDKYKLFPTKDNRRKDTLFWEFGKNISKISGHSHDIRIVIAGSSGALSFAGEREEIEKIISQLL